MNDPSTYGSSDSLNAVNWFIDDPGDGAARPFDPKLLSILKAEQERIKRAEATQERRQNGQAPRT